MIGEILAALEGTALAASLRGSVWAYPLVNAAHILGIALLVGGIAGLDLRLIGLWRSVPLDMLSRVLVPVAASGLLLAAVAGGLLFIVKAGDYAASSLFRAKMVLLGLGVVNAVSFHAVRRRTAMSRRLRRAFGLTSLILWVSVLVLGRLVGYF